MPRTRIRLGAGALVLAFLSILSFFAPSTLGALLAIDYGSDWMKASLLKPGVPFDVVLNRDSKRKIQSTVGWKGTDRLFGSDAYNLAARFPTDSFSNLKELQGVPFDSEATAFFTQISSAEIFETERHTVGLRRPNGTEWNAEELVGMQLAYVRELAEGYAGERIQDVVITVPAYFTQYQRDALADAIELAGMHLLSFVSDGTAVAVNYAITRSFPESEYHIIYDAGASSIRATLVNLTSVQGEPKAKPPTRDSISISALGIGYDLSATGTEMDRRMREILIQEFEAKHKKDIRKDKRGMAKLWKEASRVKAILSANADAQSTVESVAFDIDFRAKVSRTTFEEACADLKPHLAQPIKDALANAGLSLDNISSVILMGGTSRTPMVQAAVKEFVGDAKVAQNVNTDEAAVLGAAFYGASLSRQFKQSKEIKTSDISIHPIDLSYFSEPKSDQSEPRSIRTTIFPAGTKLGTKKTLTFKRTDDFSVTMSYKDQPFSKFPTDLLVAEISGVAEALANLTERGAVDPVVKATVILSESGFSSIQDVHVFGEIKDDSFTGKLKGFFGAGSSSESETVSDSSTLARPDTESSTSTSSSSSASPSSTAETKKAEKVSNTIPLQLNLKPLGIPALTPNEKTKARTRLVAIDRYEASLRRKEEVRNRLEGYLYRLRDLLNGEGKSAPQFQKCSKDVERNEMTIKLEETFTWLYEEGDLAETADFLDKQATLELLEKPVITRFTEIQEWPSALNTSQMWNWHTRMFLAEATMNLTREQEEDLPSKWTREELDALDTALREHEEWLKDVTERQRQTPMDEDPVVLVAELKAHAKALETQLNRLARRKIPKAVKKTTSSSAASTSTTAGTEDTGPAETKTSVVEPTAIVDGSGQEPLAASEASSAEAPEETHTHDEL